MQLASQAPLPQQAAGGRKRKRKRKSAQARKLELAQALAEAERKREEAERKREEAERKSAEEKRKREEAERKREEAQRKSAEEKRKREEAERKSAKEKRKREEEKRKREEEKRKREEAQRKSAKEKRKREEAQRELKAAKEDPPSLHEIRAVSKSDERARFERVGGLLKAHQLVKGVARALQEIIADGQNLALEMAFVVFDGPSGVGKTQLALTLLDHFKGSWRGEFLLMKPAAHNKQKVHEPYIQRSRMFLSCIAADKEVFSDKDTSMFGFPENARFETARFVARLFGLITDEDASKSKGISAVGLRKLVLEHNARPGNKPLVLFIDEVPTKVGRDVQFARNLLRTARIGVVMLGTNATLANIVNTQHGQDCSRGDEAVSHWATVVSRFPPIDVQSLETPLQSAYSDLPSGIKALVDSAQPWMGRLFLDEVRMQKERGPLSWNASALAAVCAGVKATVLARKNKAALSCEGQWCMLLAAYYGSPENELLTDLVTNHFARLKSAAGLDRLQLDDTTLKVDDSEWVPEGEFPLVAEQPLLFLVLMSPPMFAKAIGRDGKKAEPVTAARGFVLARPSLPRLNPQNPKAASVSGDQLEALGVAFMIAASHLDGLCGCKVRHFLPALLMHLRNEQLPPAGPRGMVLLSTYQWELQPFLDDVVVPFLAPPNNEWPQWLSQQVGDAKFGSVERPANAQRVDAFVHHGNERAITAEMKDRVAFNSKTFKAVLERLPQATKVHLVFARERSLVSDFKSLSRDWDALLTKQGAERAEMLRSAALVRAHRTATSSNVLLQPVLRLPRHPKVLVVLVPVAENVIRPFGKRKATSRKGQGTPNPKRIKTTQ